MRELVIGSGNPGKIQEIRMLLEHLDVHVLSLDDFPMAPAVLEDRETLESNALKKATETYSFTQIPSLADDTGLEVAALGGRPGVHSARYAGTDSDAVANRRLLLEELADVTDRSARFRTVVAYVDREDTFVFEGVCSGTITQEERGQEGFGYDAVFVPDGHERTFAQMSTEEKNRISHRAKALRSFVSFLEKELAT